MSLTLQGNHVSIDLVVWNFVFPVCFRKDEEIVKKKKKPTGSGGKNITKLKTRLVFLVHENLMFLSCIVLQDNTLLLLNLHFYFRAVMTGQFPGDSLAVLITIHSH